jgi:uncharacterized damage-inducible protein DinB
MSTVPFAPDGGAFRARRPTQADDRTTAVTFLCWHRQTLSLKCAGLDPAQLAQRAVGRSELTLLGLVRHAAETERFWFRRVMAGEDAGSLYADAFDVAGADATVVRHAWEAWQTEIAYAEKFVDAAADLDIVGDEPGEGPVSLRWVLSHLLEEYARHNGHADLLREQVDGTVGI